MSEPAPAGNLAAAAGGATADTPRATSAGVLLRAARERQGTHLAVLAAALKVAPRKLELMEADRHGELPGPSFVRALALSMCRALKIDAEPVLAQLPRHDSQVLDAVAHGLNQPLRERGAPAEPGEWPRWLSLPVVGAALLIAAAALVYVLPVGFWSSLRPASGDAAQAGSSVPATPGAAPEPVDRRPSVAPEPAPAVSADTADTAAPPPAAATPAQPAAPAASAVVDTVFLAPPEGGAAAGAGAGVLSVRASGESWVEVRDKSGQVLLSRTLVAGESAGVDGTPPFKVTVGNAGATELLFRGKPVSLAAGRDNVARVELK